MDAENIIITPKIMNIYSVMDHFKINKQADFLISHIYIYISYF